MKYVEAMRLPVESHSPIRAVPDRAELDDALTALEAAHPKSCDSVTAAFDAYVEAVEEHRCDEGWTDGPQLVPVGTTEDLDTQMERAGFLRAEEVAIVRLSDLRELIQRAEMTHAKI